MEHNVWEEEIVLNPAQMAYLLMQAKNKYVIYSRGTGKSFIVGAEVDENVRIMPRGVTTLDQDLAIHIQALGATRIQTIRYQDTHRRLCGV